MASGALAAELAPHLPPYHNPPARRWVYVGYGLLALWSLLYGLIYAFFTPFLALAFAVPLVVLAALAIWALPSELPSGLDRWVESLFFLLLVVLIVWPNYLAVALPGLPWITLVRLVAAPLLVVFLIHLSTSPAARSTISAALETSKITIALYLGFVFIQVLSIVFSHDKSESLDGLVTAQTTWTLSLFASVLIFSKPGRIQVWAGLVWGASVLVAVIGLAEYRLSHVVWAGHVPSFLRVDNADVRRIMAGQMRAGTGIYRVQSTFSSSVGLAEFVAYAMPFVAYFIMESYPRLLRLLALATVPLLLAVVIVSGSRLGMIGVCITFLAYVLAWGAIRWRRVKGGLLGPLIVYAYPAFFVVFLAATAFVGHLRRLVWGGAETDPSTQARETQYQMGWPKIVSHPWGYGIGQGAVTLGYREPGGLLTIDAYYLTVALEYGVVGFVLYYGTFLTTIGTSAKYVLTPFERNDRETGFLLAALICLINFVIIKSVFSQQDNHPIVFMVLGMVIALINRLRFSSAPSTPARS